MEVTGVTKDDLGRVKSLQNLLATSKIKVSPTDCAAIGDLMLWLQSFSAQVGRAFQKPAPVASTPAQPLKDEPLKVIDYHPGEITSDDSSGKKKGKK